MLENCPGDERHDMRTGSRCQFIADSFLSRNCFFQPWELIKTYLEEEEERDGGLTKQAGRPRDPSAYGCHGYGPSVGRSLWPTAPY